jgi:hypothetical protein
MVEGVRQLGYPCFEREDLLLRPFKRGSRLTKVIEKNRPLIVALSNRDLYCLS